ncbi:MAG TPA: BTAD domain-containing putative transcriptional regulator [Chloroflexota bacterium]
MNVARVTEVDPSAQRGAQPTTAANGPKLVRRLDELTWPLFIRIFGGFQLLQYGEPVNVRVRGKSEALLQILALESGAYGARDVLLDRLWPDSSHDLACQSLNSLVYFLNKLLRDALGGAPPVINEEGGYRLNREMGVATDIGLFDEWARTGDQHAIAGDDSQAIEYYSCAVNLYRGDLQGQDDVDTVLRREHLRAKYLTLLARLAQYHFMGQEYEESLDYALRLLHTEPCREDAHRMVMACYVRRGERAQALRQYRLCETILCNEFGAKPEPATTELFEQTRDDPASV